MINSRIVLSCILFSIVAGCGYGMAASQVEAKPRLKVLNNILTGVGNDNLQFGLQHPMHEIRMIRAVAVAMRATIST